MAKKTIVPPYEKYGLSKRYWDSLSPSDHALYDLVRPLRSASYSADHMLGMLERGMEAYEKSAQTNGGTFELNPDFQRGHVWSEAKQVAYVENLIRGMAPRVLKFNSAGWNSLGESNGDLHPNSIVCVDGLQRLTAVRRFVANEIKAFGLSYEELHGTAFHPANVRVTVEMYDIKNRADLLQFYLDLNSGGVMHTDAELDRVRGLLDEAKANVNVQPPVSENSDGIGETIPTDAPRKRRAPR